MNNKFDTYLLFIYIVKDNIYNLSNRLYNISDFYDDTNCQNLKILIHMLIK